MYFEHSLTAMAAVDVPACLRFLSLHVEELQTAQNDPLYHFFMVMCQLLEECHPHINTLFEIVCSMKFNKPRANYWAFLISSACFVQQEPYYQPLPSESPANSSSSRPSTPTSYYSDYTLLNPSDIHLEQDNNPTASSQEELVHLINNFTDKHTNLQMGCDGGTIPRRDELVRVKKKPEQKDKDAELAFLWKCCAITQEALQEPIVMCHLGKLYNKMSLIEALLDRNTMAEDFRHIRSLKDVKDLKLTKNPEYKEVEDKKGGAIDPRGSPYICPVLGIEMSGKHRFVAVWKCGCVFSERAFKEIGTKNCHKCTKPFEDEDIVILNGNKDDLAVMKERMLIRQQKNKAKKEKKIKAEEIEATTSVPVEASTSSDPGLSKGTKRPQPKIDDPAKKIKSEKTGSLSKIGNVISTGKVTSVEELKKIKPDYSIAKDNKATNVYKSLFTTHESEKQQTRAHWITYNPFYN